MDLTWPELDPLALRGPAGEIVHALEPHTEADSVTLLMDFLAAFGSAAGPRVCARAGADEHPARLSVAIVGKTSKARKGSGWSMVRSIMQAADEEFCRRIVSGFGSGERIIDEVADPGPEDPPRDRRLFIREAELARIMTVGGRDSSILSMVIREAWDGGTLSVRTRGSVTTATGAHISVLGDITVEELRRTLTSTDIANGFANRFLFVLARRSKLLPSGGQFERDEIYKLGGLVHRLLARVPAPAQLRRTTAAQWLWDRVYAEADKDDPDGLLGAVIARAEAQMLRLSVVYALLDGTVEIDVEHVAAAVAVWSYCRESARQIFAETTGYRLTDKILEALIHAPGGLTTTEISNLFSRHVDKTTLDKARRELVEDERIRCEDERTTGRPAKRWHLLSTPSSLHSQTFIEKCRPYFANSLVRTGLAVEPHADSEHGEVANYAR